VPPRFKHDRGSEVDEQVGRQQDRLVASGPLESTDIAVIFQMTDGRHHLVIGELPFAVALFKLPPQFYGRQQQRRAGGFLQLQHVLLDSLEGARRRGGGQPVPRKGCLNLLDQLQDPGVVLGTGFGITRYFLPVAELFDFGSG
jgi:hypothetical protein